MIKNVAIGLFVVIFSIIALNHYKLLPSNKTLAFNNITTRQEKAIESFSVIEKTQQSDKFTDRVAKKPFLY
tara:strand:- start:1997 stop:2209 length:213 start_codon:yes stop_codon:yes gene_type:complete